jgi:probable HAF family extracellular repeat protein
MGQTVLKGLRIAIMLVAASSQIAEGTPQYRVTVDFQQLVGGTNEIMLGGLNSAGDVVGTWWDTGGMPRGFVWQGSTVTTVQPPEGCNQLYFGGINDSGVAIGHAWTAGTTSEALALAWQSQGFDILCQGGASDINASGQIVGVRWPSTTTAWLWLPSPAYGLPAGLHDLFMGYPNAISDTGTVAGYSSSEAVLWSNGGITTLPSLSGGSAGALDVNAAGTGAGWSALPDGSQHAVRWQNLVPEDLGVLAGYETSYAQAINASGDVVGYTEFVADGRAYDRAILWTGGDIVDLSTLLVADDAAWALRKAVAINDHGQILCTARNDQGQYGALLLNPVPEPVTLSLLTLGVLALRRRR